jgi:hypothetical protein
MIPINRRTPKPIDRNGYNDNPKIKINGDLKNKTDIHHKRNRQLPKIKQPPNHFGGGCFNQ